MISRRLVSCFCGLALIGSALFAERSVQVRALGVEVNRTVLYSPHLENGEIRVGSSRFSEWQAYTMEEDRPLIEFFFAKPEEGEDWSGIPSLSLTPPGNTDRILIVFATGPEERLIAEIFPDRDRREDEVTVLNFSPFQLALRVENSIHRVAPRGVGSFASTRRERGNVQWVELSMVAVGNGQRIPVYNRAPLRVYEGRHPYIVVVLARDPITGQQLSSEVRRETIHDRIVPPEEEEAEDTSDE